MSRSINAIISRAKKLYVPAVSNSVMVAVVGPGMHIHDIEAERRPGICPGIVLPDEVRTQTYTPIFGMAKMGRSRIIVR